MRTLRYGLLGLCLVMSSARFASAQETRPTIAVIKLDVASIGSNVGDMSSALADMITTELAKHPNVRVIDRVQVQDLLLKQKLLLSGRVSDEDALKAGKLRTTSLWAAAYLRAARRAWICG